MESKEETTRQITQDEIDSILKGIRPDDMEFIAFKKLRALMNRTVKGHLRGKLFFKSVHMEPVKQEDGTTKYRRNTATYVKEKEVR